MASNNIVANPDLFINGEGYAIVPNSLFLVRSKAVKSIKAAAMGPALNTVYSDNLEDAVGEVNFKLFMTPDNINNMNAVQDNLNSNIVEVVGSNPAGTITFTMSDAAVVNAPELNLQSEGQGQYQMQGSVLA